MRKSPLTGNQMSSVEFVERAAEMSRELTRMRTRGPGDIENAMRELERDYGLDYWITWRLRYRLQQIKDIGIGVYARIEAAHRAEHERQQRKHALSLEITRAICGNNHPAVVAAAALVGETPPEAKNASDVSTDDRT